MNFPLMALIFVSFTTLGILLICFVFFDFDNDRDIFDPFFRSLKFIKNKISNLFKIITRNFEF